MQLELDHRDTQVLKGLAILAIALHNFFHILSPARENEFVFHPAYFFRFVRAFSQPEMAVQAFFSFFGHYGVDVFIFLSAYGLARSHWNDDSSWVSFLASRSRKLYPAICVVVLPWLWLLCNHFGFAAFLHQNGLHLALMLLGVSTLLPGFGLPPIGPWWFIPFILQFYALFPLLRRFTTRFGWLGLALLAPGCLLLTHLINPHLALWNINLLNTPFGHMPCVCLGIVAARFPLRIHAGLACSAGAVLILGNIYPLLWPLTFVASVILAIWIYLNAKPLLKGSELLTWMGASSLLLFLLNGIVRIPFLALADTAWSQLWAGSASVAVTLLTTFLIERFCAPMRVHTERLAPETALPPLLPEELQTVPVRLC